MQAWRHAAQGYKNASAILEELSPKCHVPQATCCAQSRASNLDRLLLCTQADLLDPASLRAALGSEEQFDSVLDSAVFHCFTDAQQEAYAANISAYVQALSALPSWITFFELSWPSIRSPSKSTHLVLSVGVRIQPMR
jgi:hypothetical protein